MATIVVADDQPDILHMLTMALERLGGHRVLAVRNGQEALEIAIRTQPDLILMDLNMPVMDGWHATEEIKARPALANIPIIAVTGLGWGPEGQRALDAGCCELLEKPP